MMHAIIPVCLVILVGKNELSANFENAEIAKALNLEEDANLKGQELTLAQLKKLNLSINKQGQVINAQNKVVGESSKSTTYLFEQIREILAGFGPVVLEFVGFLPRLFDPFTKMTEALMHLRDQAQEFVSGFNKNIDVFEKIATEMSGSADAASARRSAATTNPPHVLKLANLWMAAPTELNSCSELPRS